jgi:hypothetical protein
VLRVCRNSLRHNQMVADTLRADYLRLCAADVVEHGSRSLSEFPLKAVIRRACWAVMNQPVRWESPSMSRFVPVDRQTGYLLQPSVEDWLPEDHLARFVVEVIAQMISSGRNSSLICA